MPRYGKLTCPNCGVKIRFVTLHRIRVLGTEEGRRRAPESVDDEKPEVIR